MVQGSDIRDKESLRAWLEDQPREVSVWIASRAAARLLPLWWQAVLIEEWARERDVTALPVLSSNLISSVAFILPTETVGGAAAYAASIGKYQALGAVRGGIIALANALVAEAVVAVGTSRAAAAVHTIEAAYTEKCAVDAYDIVKVDAKHVRGGSVPDALPLWPEGPGPIAETWERVKARVAEGLKPEEWQFWTHWYDALLDGRPMLGDAARTWEMLEKIALIDPATWDKGPEVVNPVIRGIWELHRLRAEVAALQAEKEVFLAVQASTPHRGHNQPPEGLVDDAPEVARQITIIWDGLDEAREEMEQVAPDKGVLRVIAERMLAALNAVVAYCSKVADTAVMSAAKVGGGAVGTGMLDHFANNGRLMQFAKDLLVYGLGG